MKKRQWPLLAAALFLTQPAAAEDTIKLGYLASFTGPLAPLGTEVRDGFLVGLDQSGGKIGDKPAELVYGDDQANPSIGRQLADKMIEQDHVTLVTGTVTSAVMLAIARPIAQAGTFLVGTVGGPSQLAGAQCSPNVFVAGLQNDIPSELVGKYMTDHAVPNVYVMAANYAAGKDKVAGFRRFFKGTVLNEVYTPMTQMDFAGDLARLRDAKPAAVFVFYSGELAINYVKQYKQAGLDKLFPLYADISLYDESTLAATGDAGIGGLTAAFWSQEWPQPATQKFIADYQRKYNRKPGYFAVFGYDTERALDAALRETKGDTTNQDAFRHALMTVKFPSLRENFRFAPNHMATYDWYLARVTKADDGTVLLRTSDKIARAPIDSYAGECPMK